MVDPDESANQVCFYVDGPVERCDKMFRQICTPRVQYICQRDISQLEEEEVLYCWSWSLYRSRSALRWRTSAFMEKTNDKIGIRQQETFVATNMFKTQFIPLLVPIGDRNMSTVRGHIYPSKCNPTVPFIACDVPIHYLRSLISRMSSFGSSFIAKVHTRRCSAPSL